MVYADNVDTGDAVALAYVGTGNFHRKAVVLQCLQGSLQAFQRNCRDDDMDMGILMPLCAHPCRNCPRGRRRRQ